MKKILIVEDEPEIKKVLAAMVIKMGYTTILASNGKTAWTILQENPDVDLIVTDIAMPEMDGRKLINHIRSSDEFKNTPVLIISGQVSIKEISGFIEHGATAFIAKPISFENLNEYLKKYLKE